MKRSVVFVALLACALQCGAKDDEQHQIFYAGYSLSEGGLSDVDLSADFILSDATAFGLALEYGDGDSDQGGNQESVGGGLNLAHDFSRWQWQLAGDWFSERGDDDDKFESRRVASTLAYTHGAWQAGVNAQWREADLKSADPLGPDTLPEILSLTVESLGVGLELNLNLGERVQLFLGRQHYSFSNSFDLLRRANNFFDRLPDTISGSAFLERRNPRLARLVLLQPTLTTFSQGFYRFTTDLGINVDIGDHSLGVDFAQNKLAVRDSNVRNLNISWQHALKGPMDLRFSVGVIEGRSSSLSSYGGIGLYYFH